jgi:hypothetical protein
VQAFSFAVGCFSCSYSSALHSTQGTVQYKYLKIIVDRAKNLTFHDDKDKTFNIILVYFLHSDLLFVIANLLLAPAAFHYQLLREGMDISYARGIFSTLRKSPDKYIFKKSKTFLPLTKTLDCKTQLRSVTS